MEDLIMDESVVHVTPTIIDVIDLTKESPLRSGRSCHRNIGDASSNHNTSDIQQLDCYRRPLSPIVLGNTKIYRSNRRTVHYSTNKTLVLDDSIKEDEETCHTAELGNKEPSLTCPICFESLMSDNRKPITTRCGHLFCTECLESVIRASKKCPTCKSSITLKSCIRIYF